jgi:hypothetical protein
MELERACKVLAEAKPQGCEAALQRVRTFARKGHALDRAQAIEWLGICQDKDSLNFLKDCLKSEESWIGEAAQKALKMVEAKE